MSLESWSKNWPSNQKARIARDTGFCKYSLHDTRSDSVEVFGRPLGCGSGSMSERTNCRVCVPVASQNIKGSHPAASLLAAFVSNGRIGRT
eukprot:9662740-Karenia_brevis.AAC.1